MNMTVENKAVEKIQNGYNTILTIFENGIEVEAFPRMMLLVVDEDVDDKFRSALKDIGNDVLKVGTVRIWASSRKRLFYCMGIGRGNLDVEWKNLIEELKLRTEMF
jgi:D-Tyr-tRNAtyr deacylase